MYSLYRAWLSLGPLSGALPQVLAGSPSGSFAGELPQPLAGVPDVSLQVGPSMTHFSAHRAVLSAHSGFFKAALMNHTGRVFMCFSSKDLDVLNECSTSRWVTLSKC